MKQKRLDKKTDEQFELLGQTIVKECDILIALYDGKESQGKGGTAEIYKYAKEKNRRVIRIPAKRKGTCNANCQ